MRGDEFLDLYKQLENALEEKYSGTGRRYSSVVFEYLNSAESAPVRERLGLCREIRNFLTHNANIGGEPIVEPSASMVETLRDVLEYVCRPPLAMDLATRAANILRACPGDHALRLMEKMEQNGFSHVPVLENGGFCGVFSMGSVFAYTLKNPDRPIGRETTVREVLSARGSGKHAENYRFVGRRMTAGEARRMFETIRGRGRRLAVIFITETGSQDEPLLAMLTPWDVMGER